MTATGAKLRTIEDEEGRVVPVLDLYHRTSLPAARSILRTGRFESHCQNRCEAFFSDAPDGRYGRSYGDAVVHAEVAAWVAIADDEFTSGETFYRVALGDLGRDQILSAFTIDSFGARTPIELEGCSR